MIMGQLNISLNANDGRRRVNSDVYCILTGYFTRSRQPDVKRKGKMEGVDEVGVGTTHAAADEAGIEPSRGGRYS